MGFQFEIIYKPGVENKATDALFKTNENQELNAVYSSPYWLDLAQVKVKIKENPHLVKVVECLHQDPTSKSKFMW